MGDRLAGQHVLLTSADRYMGPAIVDLFRAEGATVAADTRDLGPPGACEAAVAEAEPLDVLVANLAEPPRQSLVRDIADDDWHRLFDALVHPLMWLADQELVGRMLREIPARRLAAGRETAELALFLASGATGHLVGQVVPFAGGWVTTT